MMGESLEEDVKQEALSASSERGGVLPDLEAGLLDGEPEREPEKVSLWRLLAAYTAAFAVLAPFVFWVFWRRGLSFVEQGDGWTQHINGLAYYGMWLRELTASWLSGEFAFPTFSLSIGYGADVLSTLQYYVIGDPLNLLSIFVQPENTEALYDSLVIVRFYLAGLACVFALRYLRRTENLGIVIAAISYVFSGWMIVSAVYHPFFANPLIDFPIVIAGVERIIRQRKVGLLIGAVALSAVTSFYFFFMIALLTACYVVVRLIGIAFASSFRASVRDFAQITVAAITGVGIAAFALLPVVMAFLQSSRTTMPQSIPLRYWDGYYHKLLLQPLALKADPGKYAYAYAGPLALLAVFWLFVRWNHHWLERVLLLLAIVFFTIPYFGHVFNGMGYYTNRWSWGFAFLLAYLISVFWEEVWDTSASSVRNLILVAILYAAAGGLLIHRMGSGADYFAFEVVAGMVFLFAALAALLYGRGIGTRLAGKGAVSAVVVIGVVLSSYWRYMDLTSYSEVGKWKKNYESSVASVVASNTNQAANDFVRYEKRVHNIHPDNSSLRHGLSSTEFYWSIDTTNLRAFYEALGIADDLQYMRQSLDARSITGSLLGVQYYSAPPSLTLPYGMRHIADYIDGRFGQQMTLHEREVRVPLGYSSAQILDRQWWQSLAPSEKEEALLHGVVIDGKPQIIRASAEVRTVARQLPFDIMPGEGVTYSEGMLVTQESGQFLDIIVEGASAGELHIVLRGLAVSENVWDQIIDATFECGNRTTEGWARVRTPANQWYEGRTEFVVNSHWCDEPFTKVRLTMSAAATHTFDSLEVWSQPLEGFEEAVAELAAEPLENVDFHDIGLSRATSEITGDITVSEPKVLVVTIPKTDGWTAYVDGKQQDILTANIMWMGLELEPGHHDIRLVYRTPGLYEGAAVSGVTLLGLLLYAIVARRRKGKGDDGASGTSREATGVPA